MLARSGFEAEELQVRLKDCGVHLERGLVNVPLHAVHSVLTIWYPH